MGGNVVARVAFVTVLLAASAVALAQPAAEIRIAGELKAIHVEDPTDRRSPGSIVVDGRTIAIPPMLPIELPGDRLTLQELLVHAPERCRMLGQSGLLRSDTCTRPVIDPDGKTPIWSADMDDTPRTSLDPEPTDDPPVAFASVTAVRADDGQLLARAVALTEGDGTIFGAVSYVNADEGYLRVGGAPGAHSGGAFVRLNDPQARHSVQSGTACGSEGNCSPDVRWRVSSLDPTVRFAVGYSACIPGGLGDSCSLAIRPVTTPLDANVMVPIRIGDHINARGAFQVVDGVRVFWAHTVVVDTSPLARSR